MAGEFLTVGKLFKRGYEASVTFGTAKSVDVLVYNPKTNKNFNVQIKTLRAKNCFDIKKEQIIKNHIYVFIILNNFELSEEFFIVPGNIILKKIDHFFGSSYRDGRVPKRPRMLLGPLKEYKDKWGIFDK
jgi:hypothetical protein